MRNRAERTGRWDRYTLQTAYRRTDRPARFLAQPSPCTKKSNHTRNSYIIRKKPKSFFKRLGEVFSPGKADSTQVNNVIQEEYRYADRGIQSGRYCGHHVEKHTEPSNRYPTRTYGNGQSPHPVPAPQRLETKSESQSAIKYYRGGRASFWAQNKHIQRGIYSPKLYPHSGGNRHCRCGSGYFLSGPDMERHHSQQPLPPRTGKKPNVAPKTYWRRVKN